MIIPDELLATFRIMPDWSIRHGIASAQHLLRVAQQHGAPLATCLAGTGISAAMIADAESEITAEQELRLIQNVVAALPNSAGLALDVGLRYQLTDFGIWGYALFSSRSLRSAMALAFRYLDLSFIFGELRFEETPSVARLHLNYGMIPADIRRFLMERDAAAILAVQRLVAPNLNPARMIRFGFPKPAHAERYAHLLGWMPEFGAPSTVIELDARVLNQPLPQANEATLRMCEAECQKVLARRRARSGVSARVRDLILRRPAQAPDMDAIAAELCMTSRTLRRHLAEEGITYRALRDEVLLSLADELIGTARMKLSEVAERLGYSDAAAFSHAYKRWKGVTPGTARAA